MLKQLYVKPYETYLNKIRRASSAHASHLVTDLDDSARAVFLAHIFQKNPRPMLVVESIATKLAQLYEDLNALLPQGKVAMFLAEENLVEEFSIASFDSQAMRVEALSLLLNQESCIIVTNVGGLRKNLMPKSVWQGYQLHLEPDTVIERQLLETNLSSFGFLKTPMVQGPGEYSVRGSIIDFYPLNTEHPLRIDFFDDEIDSMRFFNVETQESIKNIDSFKILPVRDVWIDLKSQQELLPILREEAEVFLKKMKDREAKAIFSRQYFDLLDQVQSGRPLLYPATYLEKIYGKKTSIVDYLGEGGLLVINEIDRIQHLDKQLLNEDHYWFEQEVAKGNLLPKLTLRLNAGDVIRNANVEKLYFSIFQKGLGSIQFNTLQSIHSRPVNHFYHQLDLLKTELDHLLKSQYIIQILVATQAEARKLQAELRDHQLNKVSIQAEEVEPGVVNIMVGHLNVGFELPIEKWIVITGREIFNKQRRKVLKKQVLSNAEKIKNYQELALGDYVVHVHHGIGQYTGIETLEINGIHRDMLAIVYRDHARILIPIDQIQSLQKYVASEGATPKLNKLGGTEWAKTKNKVASKIEDIADELIALYAERENQKGFAFSPDTKENEQFMNTFSYVETDDQLRSYQEIKKDMEQERPMDRLLVGDVGYGKTEVAMRAAFKAVMDNKQVAFLVPTTILAQQHYNTIIERFSEFPINIGLLSRFVSTKKQKETIEKINRGQIDIVVGTHRLLSKDIEFNDLGLLVVDEEQRFGVKHKERLKQIKSQVDVLTLTATPIPRTLHMSMIGVRDLSVLETPPTNRYPVQTYVMERNNGAIKSAIEREIGRGGQVFYLYNRVATIDKRAQEIAELVPGVRVAVAHGQMTEVQLETVLIDFINGAYDVLVTTTIIETGVDIPNVNTLFIDNADHMGLSTLYQLRGRVGRTNRIAYAYMMYDPFKPLSEVSEKRLSSIKEFTELGSGFKIAMRDLSIRGAGNLLGKQQSGFIDSVGFDMYSQMLKEAIDIKRGLKNARSSLSQSIEWDLAIDAYIPKSYIEDERQKIAIYKSIQRIDSMEAYRAVQDQLIDRFGEFPNQVSDLLDIALIKHFGLLAGIEKIIQQKGALYIIFNEPSSAILHGPLIFELVEKVNLQLKFSKDQNKLKIEADIRRLATDQWLGYLITLTESIANYFEEVKGNEIR